MDIPKPLLDWYEKQNQQPELPATPSPEPNPLSNQKETSYLNVIGALLEVINGTAPNTEKHPGFKSQAELVNFIDEKYKGAYGLGKTSLDTKFADAKRTLNDSLR